MNRKRKTMNSQAVPLVLQVQGTESHSPRSERLQIWEQEMMHKIGYTGSYMSDSYETTTYCPDKDDTGADGDHQSKAKKVATDR